MHILAIDFSAIFRRFFEATKNDDIGGAFTGTVDCVARCRDGFDRVVIALDSGASFRKLLWPAQDGHKGYKGNRTDPGEIYREQARRTVERLRKDGCVILDAPPYLPAGHTPELGSSYFAEADDVLAAVCRWAKANNHAVRILTTDKDLLQLVDDEAAIEAIHPDDGVVRTEEVVINKYRVAPKKIPLWLALCGDTSDHYNPYPGIGPKTAEKLIAAFAPGPQAGIDSIFARQSDFRALLGDSQTNKLTKLGPEPGRRALAVATLVADLPIDCSVIDAEPVRQPLTAAPTPPPPAEPEQQDPPREIPPMPCAPRPAPMPASSAPPAQAGRFDPLALEPRTPEAAWWLAQVAFNSRCFKEKYGNPEAAYIAILEGRALGMSAVTSLKNATIIGGNIGWHARCLRGQALRHPDCEYFDVEYDAEKKCATAVYKRRGRPEQRYVVTLEDAERRGFAKQGRFMDGPNRWITDPQPMLIACAEREAARIGWPDVVAGLWSPEELRVMADPEASRADCQSSAEPTAGAAEAA